MNKETMKKIKAYLAHQVAKGHMSREAANKRWTYFLRGKGRVVRAFQEFSEHLKAEDAKIK